MTDVLLIQPPVADFYFTAKRSYPYGLASIAGHLRRAGFSVALLDALATGKRYRRPLPQDMGFLNAFYPEEDRSVFGLFRAFSHYGLSYSSIAETAGRSGAFLVGISALFTAYVDETIETARVVKQVLPQSRIVVGGHHATQLPESLLLYPEIDFVLRGEGELSMPLLARCLKIGGNVEAVPGIAFRRPDGGETIHPPAYLSALSSQGIPAFDLVDHRFYRRKGRSAAVVTASRGCPMSCSYCATGKLSGIPYRRRAVADVIEEIERLVTDFGAGFIDFEDENLSSEKPWFVELLAEVVKRFGERGLELRAMNGLFPPSIDEETAEWMSRAGFRALNLSLGTTNPIQAMRFQRPEVSAAFDRALALAERFGMGAVGYILVGAPGQDPESSLQDLLFLAGRRVLAGISVYYPAPGSADFDRCRRRGLLPERFGLMRATALPTAVGTARQDSATLLRLGRVLNFTKQLVDCEGEIPPPEFLEEGARLDPGARRETGARLLSAFLHDGRIRGVSPEGRVFFPVQSRHLAGGFAAALRNLRVRGVNGVRVRPA